MSNKKEEIVYLERKAKGSRYDTRLIMKIVKEIESGVPRKAIEAEYGVHPETLGIWIRRYSSADYQVPVRKTYTTSEKRSVVRAIEGGMSVSEAVIAFDISSRGLIHGWIDKFKAENTEISISNPIEMPKKKINPLEAENRALRQALFKANLKNKALDTLIDVAEEHLKIDIRKKHGAKQSPK